MLGFIECSMNIELRLLSKKEVRLIPQLSALLQDAVDGGASVGFLAPLSDERANAYWKRAVETIGDSFYVWIAQVNEQIVGSIQLELSTKENGMHRAEVQKLFVLESHRGKGISTALMNAAEAMAAEVGRSLLVLDTQSGSKAESIYLHLGWTSVGQIPDYALSPSGDLCPTTYFYKRLGRAITSVSQYPTVTQGAK